MIVDLICYRYEKELNFSLNHYVSFLVNDNMSLLTDHIPVEYVLCRDKFLIKKAIKYALKFIEYKLVIK